VSPVRYTPFYCEENVWWLAQEPRFASLRRDVVFVSNEQRACAVFHQRAARAVGAPVVWDYHVVLATHVEHAIEVWDLDCTQGAPLAAEAWLELSFGPGRQLPSMFHPAFRIVAADEFVATFSSDRSHMRTRDGRYRAPPPAWPCISRGAPNLMTFADVTTPFAGELVGLDELHARWRAPL
jgi:hypothetical protein